MRNLKISSGLKYAWKRRHQEERDIRLWVWIGIGLGVGLIIGIIVALCTLPKSEPIRAIQFTGKATIFKIKPRKKIVIEVRQLVQKPNNRQGDVRTIQTAKLVSIQQKMDTNIKEYAKQLVGDEFWALDYIITRESGWRSTAQNPHSTAYGLCQFLNGTWKGTGYTKTSDPYKQIEAGIVYMKNRYGSITGAYQFKKLNNWY
jgi:hypothetical protein